MVLFLALVGNLLDAALTALAVLYFGKQEGNPLMRPFADKFLMMAGIKLFAVGLAWHERKRLGTYPLRVLLFVGWAATIWNLWILLESD